MLACPAAIGSARRGGYPHVPALDYSADFLDSGTDASSAGSGISSDGAAMLDGPGDEQWEAWEEHYLQVITLLLHCQQLAAPMGSRLRAPCLLLRPLTWGHAAAAPVMQMVEQGILANELMSAPEPHEPATSYFNVALEAASAAAEAAAALADARLASSLRKLRTSAPGQPPRCDFGSNGGG